VRNPLYAGNMLLYAGVGVMSMALMPWLLIIAMLWFYFQYHMIVVQEEEYLAERFGKEYQKYRKAVGRFIPKAGRYISANPPDKAFSLSEGLASERRTLQAIGIVTLLIIAKYAYIRWQA
jgi:hypothetical protein